MFWKKFIFIFLSCIAILGCIIGVLLAFFYSSLPLYLKIAIPIFIVGLIPALLRFYVLQEAFCLARMRYGEFQEFIMRWKGKKFDREWNVVEDTDIKRHLLGGLVWMWFFEKPHEYYLSWKTLKEGEKEPTDHIREKLVRVLLGDKTYYVLISEAEDSNLMPLRLVVLLTVRVKNPYKAIFGVDDWLQVILSRIAPAVRDSVSQQTYQELIKSKKGIGKEIKEHEKQEIDDILKLYGVEIVAIEIRDIDPESDEDRKATEAPIRAELDAKKVIAEAEGQAKKTVIDAEAKAKQTELIATADAMKMTTIAEATKKSNVLKFGDVHKEVAESIKIKGLSVKDANQMAQNYVITDIETERGAKTHIVLDGVDGKERAVIEGGTVLLQKLAEVFNGSIDKKGNIDFKKVLSSVSEQSERKQTEQKSQKTKNVGGIEIPDTQLLGGLTKEESDKKISELYKKRRSK